MTKKTIPNISSIQVRISKNFSYIDLTLDQIPSKSFLDELYAILPDGPAAQRAPAPAAQRAPAPAAQRAPAPAAQKVGYLHAGMITERQRAKLESYGYYDLDGMTSKEASELLTSLGV